MDHSRMIPRPELLILRYGLHLRIETWAIPERRSPFWYCYWNETPGAAVAFPDRCIELTPDIVLLIPPHLPNRPVFHHEFVHNFFHFTAEAPFDRGTEPLVLSSAAFRRFFRARQPVSVRDGFRCYTLLFELLLSIPEFRLRPAPARDPRIERALELLRSRPRRETGLRQLAARLHMSESSLSHLFKIQTGGSPHRYRMERALDLALNLLHDSANGIDEIAAAAGFADRYHFSKAFKKYFGVPPGVMRRRLHDNPE